MSTLPTTEGAGKPHDHFIPLRDPALFAGVVSRRVIAYLCDIVVIVLLMAPAVVILFAFNVISFGTLMPLTAVVFALIPLAYHTVLIGGPRSATFGMRFMDLEIRRIDGARPDYLQAALVTVVFYVSVAATSWLILLIALFSGRGRTLHDFLCGTLVVNTDQMAAVHARAL